MKTFNYNGLIAYASSFVSFVLPKIEVDEIILFGSVARKEATEKSDIDLFFNTKKNEKETKKTIKKELEKFYKSKFHEIWSIKENTLPINIESGNLDKWELKRSIISDGIVLYGKYKELPKNTKQFSYFNIKPIKNISKRNKIIRKLFGRNEKTYSSESLVKSLQGKILSPSSFIIPKDKTNEVYQILVKEKIDFISFSLQTDEIQ